ncbi:hypothetical protein BDW68DRAFT_162937 [Aspergillus falconensis]
MVRVSAAVCLLVPRSTGAYLARRCFPGLDKAAARRCRGISYILHSTWISVYLTESKLIKNAFSLRNLVSISGQMNGCCT